MKFFSKTYGYLLGALLVLAVICISGFAPAESKPGWPAVGDRLRLSIGIPDEGSILFTPTVNDTVALAATYGSPAAARRAIQEQIAAAWQAYIQEPTIAGTSFAQYQEKLPLEQRVDAAMTLAHLKFPGLQYGFGSIT
jgi:hypothetical protein